jgi:hypothetical protein
LRRPLGWREGFHGQGVNLIRMHSRTQACVDLLVTLDGSLALEFWRDNGGVPMPAITVELEVIALQAGGDDGFQFGCCHFNINQ